MARRASALDSTRSACWAPRLSASMARAPLPAYSSRTRGQATAAANRPSWSSSSGSTSKPLRIASASSIEKITPLILSAVGRVGALPGARSGRPRATPAITRTRSSLQARADLAGHVLVRVQHRGGGRTARAVDQQVLDAGLLVLAQLVSRGVRIAGKLPLLGAGLGLAAGR